MALQRQIQIISNFLKRPAGLSLFAEMTLVRQIRGFCLKLILQQIISNLRRQHLPLYEQPIITIAATMPPSNNTAHPPQQGPNNPSHGSDPQGINTLSQRAGSCGSGYSKIEDLFGLQGLHTPIRRSNHGKFSEREGLHEWYAQ